jgi:hypothetical protein
LLVMDAEMRSQSLPASLEDPCRSA